jgi:MerR family transcriptional regulator, copper efflux regulator
MSVSGYQIKDVADLSGFSPATLRYYEQIGLLPQATRSASGYRVYDDATVARLAFIGRAKQLGCSLEEIADLNTVWDAGRCGPVQDRLRSLVADKIGAARHQVGELLTLTAELERAMVALGGHRPDGPCDAECGCVSATRAGVAEETHDESLDAAPMSVVPTSQPVMLSVKPTAPREPMPIACTLNPGVVRGRVDEWQGLLVNVRDRVPIDGGVRLVFVPTVPLDEVMRLSTAEQDCCQFFTFAITIDTRGIALEVRAPDDAASMLHALFGGVA